MVIDYVMRPIFSYLRAQPCPPRCSRLRRIGLGTPAVASWPIALPGPGQNWPVPRWRRASAQRPDPMESLPFEQLLANVQAGA
ncbi:hypothetical protein [Arthrobacter sp.]|uniref:hypothetical protein n=1 Tax=Arthrobacter sp. TaxID=1667 RepID=UPI003A8D6768